MVKHFEKSIVMYEDWHVGQVMSTDDEKTSSHYKNHERYVI